MRTAFFIIAIFLLSSSVYTAKAQVACDACETLIGTVESWVDNGATEAQIQQYLNTLCSNIPQFSQVCDIVVDYGLSYVISYLQNNGSPQVLCQLLTLCPSSTALNNVMPQIELQDGISCYLCDQLIGSVESWLASSASQQEIESLFGEVCNLVPAYNGQCEAIIQAGWPTIVGWIVDSENTTQVCQKLDFCSADVADLESMPVVINNEKQSLKGNALECEACQVVVNTVENWLARNDTESTIETEIEKIFCSVGGAFTATCDAIVNAGVPDFISWVQQNEGAAVICSQLSICTSNNAAPLKPKFTRVKLN